MSQFLQWMVAQTIMGWSYVQQRKLVSSCEEWVESQVSPSWLITVWPSLHRAVKHPIQVMVWGCFSSNGGWGNLYHLPKRETTNSKHYLEVLHGCCWHNEEHDVKLSVEAWRIRVVTFLWDRLNVSQLSGRRKSRGWQTDMEKSDQAGCEHGSTVFEDNRRYSIKTITLP